MKQGRWGITLEGFSHLPFSPSATLVAKGLGASCAGSVSLRKHRLYLLHFVLLQGRERNGIWVPALWAKCHEKTFSLIGSNTDWCAGSICCWNCWNKVSLVIFIFKSIFYSWMCCLICVDFSLTFWKKGSRNNSDSSIQAVSQMSAYARVQNPAQSGYGCLVGTPARDAGQERYVLFETITRRFPFR